MEFTLALADLAGCVALLLWGVHMVQTGVQRAFGARLRAVLGRALANRAQSFLVGMGVTALLQSSTATGLMVSGFVAGGLVDLVPALAVMLGANVGTTLIVQALSFNVAAIAPVLILTGFILFRRGVSPSRDVGRGFIGLGLMLMALHQLLAIITPYEDAPSLRMLLGAIATEPVVDVILAAVLTWAAHSSVAVVLLVMSLATQSAVPPQAAFALVLGANLGTAINPLLEGAAGDDPVARRLPLGNLLNRAVAVLLGLVLIRQIGPLMVRLEPDVTRAVADFHTLFNVAVGVLCFPLLPAYARLLTRMLPARVDASDPGRPLYLDASAQGTPVVALGNAAREALRLIDVLEGMMQGLRDALDDGDRRRMAETKRMDDVLDRLNAAIKAYLSALDTDALSDGDQRRALEILTFAMNMEHAGDVVDRNLMGLARKRLKRGLAFSAEGRRDLLDLVDTLIVNLHTAGSLFMTGDARAARLLAREKEVFRRRENAATIAHFARLSTGRVESAETSALHLDLLRDLKRVNTHLVEAAAYPVLERSGDLLPSRLRGEAVGVTDDEE
ncbi:MAG: Na/Pi cotransporter family protein [Azospirillaceae bacterium]|nr:Na/Pi cotransporter family protein [Azospirillaceae bacterium]